MEGCAIRYKDIGDYLDREQKLDIVRDAKSINGIEDWRIIKPDKHHDWLDQRGGDFAKYTPIGTKDTKAGKDNRAVFRTYSRGVATSRDAWAYNSSTKELARNMRRHIEYCNSQNWNSPIIDLKQCKWDEELGDKLRRLGHKAIFDKSKIRVAVYRPFFKQFLYFDKTFNSRQSPIDSFPRNDTKNLTICVPYKFTGEFSVFVTEVTPDIQLNFNGQCFPFYTYDNGKKKENMLDGVLSEYQTHYADSKITKYDIFNYIYGLLHHPGYREKFANNLIRELPRIPMAPNFSAFRNAGKDLADLHLNFETCKRHKLGKPKFNPTGFTKLDFGKKRSDKEAGRQNVPNHAVVRANGTVLFDKIPQTTYRVNGRTPLEWVVDRYKVTTDKDSGIVNDPCTGTDIVAVIERAVHIGLESERIINTLPKEFEPGPGWEPSSDGLDKYTKGGPYQSKI